MAEKSPHVLIVDDDELIREAVKLALSYAGFKVSAAADAAQAREALKSPVDLVILDLYMPGAGGLDLLRELKSDPKLSAVPVVLFTGSRETIDVLSGVDAGAYDYITKPIDSDSLVEKIRAILKKRKAGS